MKKVLISLIAIGFLLVPFGSAFAMSGGLLDGKVFNRGSSFTNISSTTTYLTDRNVSSKSGMLPNGSATDSLWYEFSDLTNINSYYLDGAVNIIRIYFLDAEGKVIHSHVPTSNGRFNYFVDGVKKIGIHNTSSTAAANISEFDVFGETVREINHEEISEMSLVPSYDNVSLTWSIPNENPDFIGVRINRNGQLLTTLDKGATKYVDTKVSADKNYTYEIKARYSDGHITPGLTKNIQTLSPPPPPEPAGDVENVAVKAAYDRVNLSWNLPEQDNLHHVNIYRDTIEEESFFKNMFGGSVAYAAETPIFETNGTYFNDLSVEPETKYEYTLKTESDEGLESEGVTVQTQTPEEPAPKLEGGGFTETEDGDFLYSWSQPTTGKVRILVDGKEYQTVDAASKEFLIPKEDMKYDIWKNPKVSLQPISESGKEGAETRPPPGEGQSGSPVDNIKMPFTTKDAVSSGMILLTLVAPFVLLMLAFKFVPKMRNMIMSAFGKGQAVKQNDTEPREPRGYRGER